MPSDETPSWRIAGINGIQGPVEGSLYYASSMDDWLPTKAEGFWIKPLFEDIGRGEKTMLMKVDPGAHVASHTHEGELEQLFVLQGSFYDQNRTLNVGDYCCRAPNAAHSAGSVQGATLMVIYTRR
ncbi:quercetin dioxygenase-like cupin family protein [Pseudomonas corrugata]|jgi:quercetin dioxygenase-like cupin family protein|uniref:cupin domain-containing protein n=1 Tax=Pseudomonas corrugata TaxID=47879 RepID=UPI0028593953|nr:cupin domain-containing protein [Pseudomonas corrugata]MDR7283405.1 quercetin dioxygenase-like cupin family protein [Pseudomonas corrugata]